MKNYKVVIPSAGLGQRIGSYSKFVNKALLTIGNKPSISHVIEKFDIEVEILVLCGYKSDYLRQVVSTLHRDRPITFIEVDKFKGVGSGLGYSLSCAKEYLQCPFIFIANDTILPDENCDLDPNNYGNWMGYYSKKMEDNIDLSQFRTVCINKGEIVNINQKGVLNNNIYIGVCGIKDYSEFWHSMDHKDSIAIGESYGLKHLKNICAKQYRLWLDSGNMVSLQKAKRYFKTTEYNILEKENEAIWFVENEVCKFHIDDKFIADRILRTKYINPEWIPKITKSSKNLYVYEKVDGKIFGEDYCIHRLKNLLDQMQKEFWAYKKGKLNPDDIANLNKFYKEKTFARVDDYFSRFEMIDRSVNINGLQCPPLKGALKALDWKLTIQKSILSRFHGDFHNENILITSAGKFILLDWRQNFGDGQLEFGDVYYDLGKYYHGLMVNHGVVSNNLYSINYNEEFSTNINIHIPLHNFHKIQLFENWIVENKYDLNHVKLITALIFLNIACLHEPPYSHFLFSLGRFNLESINSNSLNE